MGQSGRPLAPSSWPVGQRLEPVRAPQPDTSAEIGDLWRILTRRRRTVFATTALFGLAACLYAFLTTPLYTATAQILIDPRDRQVVTNDLIGTAVAPDGGVTQVESQVRVIESDTVLMRAVAQTGLKEDPEFGAPGNGLVSRALRALHVKPASDEVSDGASTARALKALRRKLAVKRADKVFVVEVIVTVSDPDKAARIVNAIAHAYLADQAEARGQAARQASGELRGRLDGLRADVNEAETKLEAFKASNGLIASSGRLVGEQQLTDSNARLTNARTRVADAKSKLQALRDARGQLLDAGSMPEAVQSAGVERLRSQYADLTSKEADLRTQLGDRHPFIAAVRAQKNETKRLIDAELDRIVRAASVEVERAVAAERTLTGNLDGLRLASVDTAKASVTLRELERDVEARRSVYNTYLVRSREVGEQASIDPTNARIISWARPPEERSWPLRLLVIGAALAGGLGFGAGLALLREHARPTLLSRGQLERLLQAPVLATLPARTLATATPGIEAAQALDALSNLYGGSRLQHRALVVLVTAAASDGANRRTAIDALATVASTRSERVLVVEADLAAADPGGTGLLDVLRGEASLQAACTFDTATGVRYIAIGNGQKPLRGAFDTDAVRGFLTEAGARFDLIIVDAGTLNENLRVGAFAASVDRLLVLARAGATLQADLTALAGTVAALGQPISGALLVDGAR